MGLDIYQENRFDYKGYPCVVIFHSDHIFRNSYRTGYVGISKGSKFYNKDYDEIPVMCHGGLTYGRISVEKEGETWLIDKFLGATPEDKELYWIGFDCFHVGDDIYNCDLNFVEDELQSIVDQLIEEEQNAIL